MINDLTSPPPDSGRVPLRFVRVRTRTIRGSQRRLHERRHRPPSCNQGVSHAGHTHLSRLGETANELGDNRTQCLLHCWFHCAIFTSPSERSEMFRKLLAALLVLAVASFGQVGSAPSADALPDFNPFNNMAPEAMNYCWSQSYWGCVSTVLYGEAAFAQAPGSGGPDGSANNARAHCAWQAAANVDIHVGNIAYWTGVYHEIYGGNPPNHQIMDLSNNLRGWRIGETHSWPNTNLAMNQCFTSGSTFTSNPTYHGNYLSHIS